MEREAWKGERRRFAGARGRRSPRSGEREIGSVGDVPSPIIDQKGEDLEASTTRVLPMAFQLGTPRHFDMTDEREMDGGQDIFIL